MTCPTSQAQSEERYLLDELLADISQCLAHHVILLADQSYSGEITHKLKTSRDHSNVMVVSSGRGMQYSQQGELARFWMTQNDTRSCITDIHKVSEGTGKGI